jgi:hypothetical protein
MRKALIAVAVATALFAVGAFAASFAVQSEDVASGTDPVAACATEADVDFTESLHLANNDWEISAAVVTFNGAGCNGRDATLVLQSNAAGEPVVYEATKAVAAGSVTFVPKCDESGDPTPTNIVCTVPTGGSAWTYVPVSQVWNAAVLIDGVPI